LKLSSRNLSGLFDTFMKWGWVSSERRVALNSSSSRKSSALNSQ
jgi:hypothetical protein